MDIALFKTSWAGLLSTMVVVDPMTGLPTAQTMRVNAQAPMSLSETDLPTWVLFTGPATFPIPPDQSIDRLARESAEFTAELYVCLAAAGIDGEAERRVQPYVDSARDIIQSHIQLWDGDPTHRVPGIKRVYLLRRSGIGVLTYGQTKYNGITFTVRVDADNLVNYDPRQ